MTSTKSFESVDLSKFNRLITIGCSFTDYRCPTWADIMHRAMPHAEFINLGRGGAGNLYISNKVTTANRKLNFCETDLIMVMWSTHCREDRYLNGYWDCPGNIFTQDTYDEKFVRDFCHPLGYLIRDISLIDLTNNYLDSLPCTHIGMLSVPFDYQQDNKDDKVVDVLSTYKQVIDYFPTDMFNLEMKGAWPTSVTYEFRGQMFQDYHPTPINYYNYLKALGINLNNDALEYATQSTTLLKSFKTFDQIKEAWPDLDTYRKNNEDFW